MCNVISWKYTLQTQVSMNKTLEIDQIMDRIVQQAGMCNGGLETGQIDHI